MYDDVTRFAETGGHGLYTMSNHVPAKITWPHGPCADILRAACITPLRLAAVQRSVVPGSVALAGRLDSALLS